MRLSASTALAVLATLLSAQAHVQAGPATRDAAQKREHKPLRALGMALKSTEDVKEAIKGAPFFAAHPGRQGHQGGKANAVKRRRRRVAHAAEQHEERDVDADVPAAAAATPTTMEKRLCTKRATATQAVTKDNEHKHPHPHPSHHSTADDGATQTASGEHPHPTPGNGGNSTSSSNCFPALNFNRPDSVPSSTDNWWCSTNDEVAWLGFSYDVSGCPSSSTLSKSFARMRKDFDARYVRLYGACDNAGFTDDLIDAAWDASLGIYPLVWFGFDGGDQWKTRRDNIVKAVKTNPKAPFVVRGVVVGSEPMFDNVMSPEGLAKQIDYVKSQLSEWTGNGDDDDDDGTAMQVTLSEMPYGYQTRGNAPAVFKAVDVLHTHILPFFDWHVAGAGSPATAGMVTTGLDYMTKYGQGKKIIISQTGWPSDSKVWPPNSKQAVASVGQEQAYYKMLDENACSWKGPKGGVAWFSHLYSDAMLSGWGILDTNYKLKFGFKPRTSC